MKLSLPKIIAMMAALIATTLLLTSRGCNMTKLATEKKLEVQTQPGGTVGNTSSGPNEPNGSIELSGENKKPIITEWDSHNLVVLGENFIPVGEAFSTPFATFYRIDEKGYIPTQPIGPVNTDGPCQKKWYASDRAAGVDVIAENKGAAIDAASIGSGAAKPVPDCPRDLGGNLEAGSYVFGKNGIDLAGFEFKTNPHFYEILDQYSRHYLVFPEGGKGPADEPAMKKMKLETILVDAEAYPKVHDHDEAMNEIQNLIPGNTGTEIKYLPSKPTDESQQDAEDALVSAVQKEIEALIKRLDKEARLGTPAKPSPVLIGTRMPTPTSEDLRDQQKRIKAKIKKAIDEIQAKINHKLILMHFGSEIPACTIALSACRALNHSVAIYSTER